MYEKPQGPHNPKPTDLAEILNSIEGWGIQLKLQNRPSLGTMSGLKWPKLHVR